MEKLEEGVVYRYFNEKSRRHFYVELKSWKVDRGYLLRSRLYDFDLYLTEHSEKFVDQSGVRLQKYNIYHRSVNQASVYQLTANVISSQLFFWHVQPAQRTSLVFSYTPPETPNQVVRHMVNRYYDREFHFQQVMGREVHCTRFTELVKVHRYNLPYSPDELPIEERLIDKKSFYGEGIGLIRTEIDYAPGGSFSIALDKIIPIDQWEIMLNMQH